MGINRDKISKIESSYERKEKKRKESRRGKKNEGKDWL